jgi:DNA-3-methyladenine glycosylase I
MGEAGIVRNRLKIEATIANAKAYLKLTERTKLSAFLWSFLEDGPIRNRYRSLSDLPPETEHSRRMSKALKEMGFRFVGPTTVYAFMQSVGMVNDHLVTCHRNLPCAALQQTFKQPA